MKTIFRYTNTAVLMAVFIALGAVAGIPQDPCADTEGIAKLEAEFRKLFELKDLPNRKLAIDAGKQFVEKYGACPSTEELSNYLKTGLPAMEKKYRDAVEAKDKEALYKRFDAAVKASNWDEVYASGKEILAKEPDQLDLMITLGSIGYDELYAGRTNFKYNDDTIRYAKQAISALESGKTSKTYGLFGWAFKTKERALGELNLTIGYLLQVAQKNKKDAAPFLFKATQGSAETAKNSIPYASIGDYYFDELNKLTAEITEMAKNQPPPTAPEAEIKAAVDAIKAKVALSNGMAERAMDAFARAYNFASAATPTGKAYKEKMKGNVEAAYNLRFAKKEGVDAWIANSIAKPFVNPTTQVMPISDPEPASAPAAGSTTTTPPATPAKPGTTTPAKPPVTPTKPEGMPTEKPAVMAKPQAKAKKPVAKKKTS